MFFKLMQSLLRVILNTFYDVEIKGEENLPEDGSVIVCANHMSALDPLLLGAFIKRPLCFMAKHEIFIFPPLGWIVSKLGAFPVNRNSVEITSIKRALEVLKNGKAMGIFAQGGRDVSVITEDSGKAGVALFAVRGRSPVVPVGIKGSFIPFTRLIINMGKPMYFEEENMGKKFKAADLSVLTKKIMLEIKRLSEQEYA